MNETAKTDWQRMVRDWLRQNDRTQAWLCRQARLSETQFSKQMRGHRQIDGYDLKALEVAMGIPVGTLVDARRGIDIDDYRAQEVSA